MTRRPSGSQRTHADSSLDTSTVFFAAMSYTATPAGRPLESERVPASRVASGDHADRLNLKSPIAVPSSVVALPSAFRSTGSATAPLPAAGVVTIVSPFGDTSG